MRPGLRGRLLAAVILAVGLALALTVLAFNLVLGARLDADANGLLSSRAAATLDSLQIVDGRLRVQEAPDAGNVDQPIWIFAGRRLVEAPRAGAHLDREVQRLAAGPARRIDTESSTRLLSLPVTRGTRRLGTVVAGVSLSPYERSERVALIGSLAMALVILFAVGLAGRWLLRAGLRPVDRMSADAAEWSERDLDRRFGLGPPRDEFTRLGATLDGLLDRLSASVRREQRFSAELSHELRTPLAKIRARAQLALSDRADEEEVRATLASSVAETDRLTRALDALLAAARQETRTPDGYSADAREAAAAAADECGSEGAVEGRVAIDVIGGDGVRVEVDQDLIERILHPVIENACRHARSRVEIHVGGDPSEVCYLVTDDGKGVGQGELRRIFEPGVRGGSEGRDGVQNGAGLGLALARRLARAGGGEVEALSSEAGGRFSIRLPRG